MELGGCSVCDLHGNEYKFLELRSQGGLVFSSVCLTRYLKNAFHDFVKFGEFFGHELRRTCVKCTIV